MYLVGLFFRDSWVLLKLMKTGQWSEILDSKIPANADIVFEDNLRKMLSINEHVFPLSLNRVGKVILGNIL